MSSETIFPSYEEDILGIALFDLNGFPQEYFTTPESSNMHWVQTVFQSLGLKSLLMSSLRVEGFRHATIRTDKHCAVIVKQRDHYIALLICQADPTALFSHSSDFIGWLHTVEVSQLRNHPRFHGT